MDVSEVVVGDVDVVTEDVETVVDVGVVVMDDL